MDSNDNARVKALRRGACPSLGQPMETGDGLLVRLLPLEPIPVDAWIALCAAARTQGNGVMEVSQRGSLQIRGLTPKSARDFARDAAALGLLLSNQPSLVSAALLGLTTRERNDPRAVLAALHQALAERVEAAAIDPKLSVVLDGAGPLHLDRLVADIRLRAGEDGLLHLALAGDGSSATGLGWVEPARATEAVIQVIAAIARRGPGARARDLLRAVEIAALRMALGSLLRGGLPPPPRPPAEPLGTHALRDGRTACGFGLAFGHADAGTLETFAHAAARLGVVSIRPAPARSLLMIGLDRGAIAELTALARTAGFIVDAADPRRSVIACAGTPACAAARLDTRTLAPAIALAASGHLDGSMTIHVSGCAKGCAHPGPAALTLVGPNRLILSGRAGDASRITLSTADFLTGLQRLNGEKLAGVRESSADLLARVGAVRVAKLMGGEPTLA